MHLCFGLCFELIPATGEAHRKLADNNIILWPSYGNMPLLLWRNMNIMAFRGSLGNYMAVMLLRLNGIFRFSIYPTSMGGKSIRLFTFAVICPRLSRMHNSGKSSQGKVWDVSPDAAKRRWRLGGTRQGCHLSQEWMRENGYSKIMSRGRHCVVFITLNQHCENSACSRFLQYGTWSVQQEIHRRRPTDCGRAACKVVED